MKNNPSYPFVSIIVLNWNGYNDTLDCVCSLNKIVYENYQIVVVDNGSKDDEIDKIINTVPKINLIKSKNNLGFSGGNNLGIDYSIKSGAEYILLLNNDTVVEPDFLNLLTNNLLQNERNGIAVPKINYYSHPNIIWYAGGYISRLRGSGFTFGVGKKDERFNENKSVTFATGCCMLIKKDVINNIGMLDENYFLYLEDVDYCQRTLLAGYKINFVAQSKIYHKVSISTTKDNRLLPLYYVTRNRLFLTKKYFKNTFYLTFINILLIFILKSFFWLIKGEIEKILMVQKSIRDFLKGKMGKGKI